jgi:hypothetical protein
MSEKLTNDLELSGSFLGGGVYSSSQIKSRCKKYGVSYKPKGGKYWFYESDFINKYNEEELQTLANRKEKQKAESAGKKLTSAELFAKAEGLKSQAKKMEERAKKAKIKEDEEAGK